MFASVKKQVHSSNNFLGCEAKNTQADQLDGDTIAPRQCNLLISPFMIAIIW